MSLPLLAAGTGAAALKNLHPNGAALASGAAASQTPNFQQIMAAMQKGGVSLKDLMALSGPSLQAKLKTLSPQEQQSLAQKLFGASLTVTDPTGAKIQGTVKGFQLGGQAPTLDVAGVNYTLDKIQSIDHLA